MRFANKKNYMISFLFPRPKVFDFENCFVRTGEKLRKFDNCEDKNIEKLKKLERELEKQGKMIVSNFFIERPPVVSDFELG